MPAPKTKYVKHLLLLKQQEIPVGHPDSRFFFNSRFVGTRAAIDTFTPEVLLTCLQLLQRKTTKHSGLDYLQVFENEVGQSTGEPDLWLIDDEVVVTALLQENY